MITYTAITECANIVIAPLKIVSSYENKVWSIKKTCFVESRTFDTLFLTTFDLNVLQGMLY